MSTTAAFSGLICDQFQKALLHLSLSPFFSPSGTSGEDQAPSEPFSRLSKRIEGLQHLTAVPISNRPTLIGFSFKESTGEWFQSIPWHKNLCKEMVCCEAHRAASYPRGRRIDRQEPPSPTLLPAPVAMEMEYACNKIVLTLFVSAVRQETGCSVCLYVWVCACAPADLSFCCTLCRVCSNNEWHGWSLSVYAKEYYVTPLVLLEICLKKMWYLFPQYSISLPFWKSIVESHFVNLLLKKTTNI